MGANFQSTVFPKTVAVDGLQAFGAAVIDTAKYDHGHGGYSGSFAEARGVEVRARLTPFASVREADAYLMNEAEKWGPLVVVPFLAEGEVRWIAGLWCAE